MPFFRWQLDDVRILSNPKRMAIMLQTGIPDRMKGEKVGKFEERDSRWPIEYTKAIGLVDAFWATDYGARPRTRRTAVHDGSTRGRPPKVGAAGCYSKDLDSTSKCHETDLNKKVNHRP
jgi:hypothetical protein